MQGPCPLQDKQGSARQQTSKRRSEMGGTADICIINQHPDLQGATVHQLLPLPSKADLTSAAVLDTTAEEKMTQRGE